MVVVDFLDVVVVNVVVLLGSVVVVGVFNVVNVVVLGILEFDVV